MELIAVIVQHSYEKVSVVKFGFLLSSSLVCVLCLKLYCFSVLVGDLNVQTQGTAAKLTKHKHF